MHINRELIISLFIMILSVSLSAQADRSELDVGDVAPDFELRLPTGEKIRLSSLRGKVVMFQFTASWCNVCRKKMPDIETKIWQKYKDNNQFALYGIDRGESVETILSLAQTTGVTYPIGLDPNSEIYTKYAGARAGITQNVIIDKNGKILMLTRLYKVAPAYFNKEEEEFNSMVNLIDALLKKTDEYCYHKI